VANQQWSTGHVGLMGGSAVGILQFGPAALRPPHLDAIAPSQVTTDFYRDTGYPGGIQNPIVLGLFGLILQPESSDQAVAGA
jgi:predicted acyl esterase